MRVYRWTLGHAPYRLGPVRHRDAPAWLWLVYLTLWAVTAISVAGILR